MLEDFSDLYVNLKKSNRASMGRKRIRMADGIRNGSTYAEMKGRMENREEGRVAS